MKFWKDLWTSCKFPLKASGGLFNRKEEPCPFGQRFTVGDQPPGVKYQVLQFPNFSLTKLEILEDQGARARSAKIYWGHWVCKRCILAGTKFSSFHPWRSAQSYWVGSRKTLNRCVLKLVGEIVSSRPIFRLLFGHWYLHKMYSFDFHLWLWLHIGKLFYSNGSYVIAADADQGIPVKP